MKGEDLTLFRINTQLTQSHWKKWPQRLHLLNRSQHYYKTINCEKKNSAFCSVTTCHPTIASPKEHLYEQMASNPAFTERNIQNANPPILHSCAGHKLFCHISHTTELVRHVWLVNILTLTAPIGSLIICTWALPCICEQQERNLTAHFSRRCGAGTPDKPPKNICVWHYPTWKWWHVGIIFNYHGCGLYILIETDVSSHRLIEKQNIELKVTKCNKFPTQ